ncbi:MAG: ComF family protein [Gemmatimonadota bacterium]|nr:ComF family protein [Gemmatimonadota bacterium]MDE3127399.1 ComF family protein [Gemmatimonadota bacterium]MDE3171976.1 ComF family protein [Gemmatimonadota bacterium]
MTGALAGACAALGELLLPAVCCACARTLDESEPGIVCGRCLARVAPLAAPRCPRCGHPNLRPECRWCALLPPYVRAARSACWVHRGSGLALIHALKYGGWHAAAPALADRMARLDWPADVVAERAALVPVPLAPDRERERGYNQSERLARALAPRWGLPVWTHVLARTRATATQTQLTPEQRLMNVSDAFRAPETARGALRRSHVVLVDDVVTTAATLNACAAALHAAGARVISYVTFGRAPAVGDR